MTSESAADAREASILLTAPQGLPDANVTGKHLSKVQRRRRSRPGRLWLSQGASLKSDESEVCSPVSSGRIIRLCSS
jgi:hypothetical protein